MGYRVLSTNGSDRLEWKRILEQLSPGQADIHYLPEYIEVYEKTYKVQGRLSVYDEGDCFIAIPFILRPLDNLYFLENTPEAANYIDAASVYGFGGPIFRARSIDEAANIFKQCDKHHINYLHSIGAASEFTCLHPLIGNHCLIKACGGQVEKRKIVVYAKLSTQTSQIWKGLNRGNKSAVNKARRLNLNVIKAEPTPENLAMFNRLYANTMDRLNAAPRWRFPENYFSNCFKCLGPERCSLFLADVNGNVASCFMVMHDFDTAYYHFAGTDPNFFNYRPNNLLMYEVMVWAGSQGYNTFHLGGGATESSNDSLLRYKRSFSPAKANMYTTGRIVHHKNYETLCCLKHEYDVKNGKQTQKTSYFPVYRG